MVKKTKGQTLAEDILSNPKSLPEKDPKLLEKAAEFCEGYKAFLANKTEREVIDYVLPILKDHGYTEYVRGSKYKAGAKFYKVNRGKTIMMCTKGKRPVAEGIRVCVAHIDSPRLDFKPHPLFQDADMATSTAPGSISNRTHYSRTRTWRSSRPTTTAASRSTSGPPSRCPSGVSSTHPTGRP